MAPGRAWSGSSMAPGGGGGGGGVMHGTGGRTGAGHVKPTGGVVTVVEGWEDWDATSNEWIHNQT